MNRIESALAKLFDRHRIVFWYDAKKELRADFEAVSLPEVEKLEVGNNEYGIKHRLLREHPGRKFLLYREGPQPPDLENWLLDVQLAHGEFRTDQAAIWLAELELGDEFLGLVQEHPEFFQASRRREALKRLVQSGDTPGKVRMKMLAQCVGSDPRLESILTGLLAESANIASMEVAPGESLDWSGEKYRFIVRCGLDRFFWEQMKRAFGYESPEPGVKDFVTQLFKDCYWQHFSPPASPGKKKSTGDSPAVVSRPRLTGDALVFLKSWKDNRQSETSFEALSGKCEDNLGIEKDLVKRDFRDLLDIDYFRLVDQKIISDLVREVAAKTVSVNEVAQWVRQREQGRWYGEFRDLYLAVDFGARFLRALDEITVEMESLADGVQRYGSSWYRVDQFYRKFVHHARQSGQVSLLGDLAEKIENHYTNSFLLKLNDRWQQVIDTASRWEAGLVPLQKRFFECYVKPFLKKENKVCVIVSDALRYEVGEELLSLVRQEDRYDATLEPMLAMLPSFTQLGMAALLPHRELALAADESGTVLVDGQSSKGTDNRRKILDQIQRGRVAAMKSDEFLGMKAEDCRTLIRDVDVLYIYHNRIDASGDKRETEEQVFETVEQSLQDFIRLMKKLTGANLNNLLVTADHGFLYQHRPIAESDFCGSEPSGEWIGYRDRRFVLGKGLKEMPGLRKFSSAALGLAGDMEVQIPKSIGRLRLQGSGSRYVHGGASLQEVVVPVVKINKRRQSDVTVVEVEILRGASSVITSGQLAVVFYQTEAVTEKVQARKLRAGIYTMAGELVSDVQELTFQHPSDNPRDRETAVRFLLTREAMEANNQEVVLRLEEKLSGTSHYKEYKTLRYQMRRSFTGDFDF